MTHLYESLEDVCDRELEQRVRMFLFGGGYLALRQVTIDVEGGVVVLRGHVPSFHMRQVAIECAKRVAGVRQVVDYIRVVPSTTGAAESPQPSGPSESADERSRNDNPQATPSLPHGDKFQYRKKLRSSLT